jgi:hypothetical protein
LSIKGNTKTLDGGFIHNSLSLSLCGDDDFELNAASIQNQLESNKFQLQNQLRQIEDKLRETERRIQDLHSASVTPCTSWSAQDNDTFMQQCRKDSRIFLILFYIISFFFSMKYLFIELSLLCVFQRESIVFFGGRVQKAKQRKVEYRSQNSNP